MGSDVYTTIKRRILSGSYDTGEFVNEQALAKELGVSRTPIRETLARLEWEKLVTIIPRAGAMVAPAELNQIKEAYQVRHVLDGNLGRRAASRATPAQIDQLKALRERCEGLVDRGSQEDLDAIARAFRAVLGEAAGNSILFELSEMLFNICVRVWHTIPDHGEHAELARAQVSEIEAIIIAFEARNEDAAEAAMRNAVRYYTEKLKQIF